MLWFWRFVIYSFLGFLLEVAYARAAGSEKQDRKCLLLLPLCPVYGLGALLILLLTDRLHPGVPGVMLIGFLSASAVEYVMSLFYERVLHVRFWDYSSLPLNLHGRVCLIFSAVWTVLALALTGPVSLRVDLIIARIPAALDFPAMIVLLSDLLVSSAALRVSGSTDVLRWYRL